MYINKKNTGFTLLEILITIVIIGILATLAIVNYTSAKEKALDKEAIVGLKAVQAAENIYKYENGQFVLCATTFGCNSILRLDLPASEKKNWRYKVESGDPKADFRATACRNNPPSGYARYWQILPTGEEFGPTPGDGNCGDAPGPGFVIPP